MLVIAVEATYVNQNDEVLCILRQSHIRRQAAARGFSHGDRRRASQQDTALLR
jgi:hypothetical protein